MFRILALSSSLLVLLLLATITNCKVQRPRGVSIAKASLYQSANGDSWVCLDGTKTIRATQINDDYCDCKDGSDEPGTSACSQSRYHCENLGHKSQNIPSSWVNDGICDCCDTSDEYIKKSICENTCKQLGHAELEQRKSQAELHKRGSSKRAELIAKGKQLRVDRETRRAELERRLNEQESIKAEKEELKRQAESAESEALELYKEQQREQETKLNIESQATGGGEKLDSMRVEASASFIRYDTNKDSFVEVKELQVDMILDRDRNGLVTIEEAKYFLDERERIDLDGFITLSWPRIKPQLMLADGLFKPPVAEEAEVSNVATQVNQPHLEGTEEDLHERTDHNNRDDRREGYDEEDEHDQEEEEGYDDEEADVGVGTVEPEPSTPAPEYDPETQRLIELANDARHALTNVENELREIEHEIKELDDQNAKDYGRNDEYGPMDGECFTFEDREYVYTICPFDRASQKQRSGGSETTLGRWDQWMVGVDGINHYNRQKYSHGASCWNGPQRSAIVDLVCALDSKVTAVSEPNRCEYHIEFETPAACDNTSGDDHSEHDEL